jgi:hypothetical protein
VISGLSVATTRISPASTIHQNHQRQVLQMELRKDFCVADLLPVLHFREMVAAADRAEAGVRLRGFDAILTQPVRRVAVPGALQIAELFDALVLLELLAGEVGLPQAHPAPDIISDQLGIEYTCRDEGGPHGVAPARMQIGQPHGQTHARQRGGLAQLANRLAFDPILPRRQQAHPTVVRPGRKNRIANQ